MTEDYSHSPSSTSRKKTINSLLQQSFSQYQVIWQTQTRKYDADFFQCHIAPEVSLNMVNRQRTYVSEHAFGVICNRKISSCLFSSLFPNLSNFTLVFGDTGFHADRSWTIRALSKVLRAEYPIYTAVKLRYGSLDIGPLMWSKRNYTKINKPTTCTLGISLLCQF